MGPFDLVSTAILRDQYTPVLNKIVAGNDAVAASINRLNIASNILLGIGTGFAMIDVQAIKVSGHIDQIHKVMTRIRDLNFADTFSGLGGFTDQYARHSAQRYLDIMDATNMLTIATERLNEAQAKSLIEKAIPAEADMVAARPGSNIKQVNDYMYGLLNNRIQYALGARGLSRFGISTPEVFKDENLPYNPAHLQNTITPMQAIQGVITEAEKQFGGLDQYFAQHTLYGSISNVVDNWNRMLSAIGSPELAPIIKDFTSLSNLLNGIATDLKKYPMAASIFFSLAPMMLLTGAFLKGAAAYQLFNQKVLTGQKAQAAATEKTAEASAQAADTEYLASERADAAYREEQAAIVARNEALWQGYEAISAFETAQLRAAAAQESETLATERFMEATRVQVSSMAAVIDAEREVQYAAQASQAASEAAQVAQNDLLIARQQVAVFESQGKLQMAALAAADASATAAQAEEELRDATLLAEAEMQTAILATQAAREADIKLVAAAADAERLSASEQIAAQNLVTMNAGRSAAEIVAEEEAAAARTSSVWAMAAEKMDMDFMATQTKAEAVFSNITSYAVLAGEKIGGAMTAVVDRVSTATAGLVAMGKSLFWITELVNGLQDLNKSKAENRLDDAVDSQYSQGLSHGVDNLMHLGRGAEFMFSGRGGPAGFSDFFATAEEVAKKNGATNLANVMALRSQVVDLEHHWSKWSKSQMDNLAQKLQGAAEGGFSSGFPAADAAPLDLGSSMIPDPKADATAHREQWDMAEAQLDTLMTTYSIDEKRLQAHRGDVAIIKEMKSIQAQYLEASKKEIDILQAHAAAIKGKSGREAEYLSTIKEEDSLLQKQQDLRQSLEKDREDNIISRAFGAKLSEQDLRDMGLAPATIDAMNAGAKFPMAMQKAGNSVTVNLYIGGKYAGSTTANVSSGSSKNIQASVGNDWIAALEGSRSTVGSGVTVQSGS